MTRPDRYELAGALAAAWCAVGGRTVGWLVWLAVTAVWSTA
jgi:hypothetical protein